MKMRILTSSYTISSLLLFLSIEQFIGGSSLFVSSFTTTTKTSTIPSLCSQTLKVNKAQNSEWKVPCSLTMKLEDFDDSVDSGDTSNKKKPIITKKISEANRRSFLLGTTSIASILSWNGDPAEAINLPFGKDPKTFTVNTLTGSSAIKEIVQIESESLFSEEQCLLRLLPVSNKVFRKLQKDLFKAKTEADSSEILAFLDKQRSQIEPKFSEYDSTLVSIEKAERGEYLIEDLRDRIILLSQASEYGNEEVYNEVKKKTLLALGNLGELLVDRFPYNIPRKGKYAYLPRLEGRTTVTFVMERKGKPLGNVTIIADGFAAPITAGNFVDLASRGFYTGLPIKNIVKKSNPPIPLGEQSALSNTLNNVPGFAGLESALSEIEEKISETMEIEDKENMISLNVMGSYNEGFYDPLTAKLRRLPLEILRLDKNSGEAKPTYLKSFTGETKFKISRDPDLIVEGGSEKENKPVLNFETPGLVAMNHPEYLPNGASSEFFILTEDQLNSKNSKLFTGNYAPFGYVVEGYDLVGELRPGDVIGSTQVSGLGLRHLVKVKGSNLSNLMGGSDE